MSSKTNLDELEALATTLSVRVQYEAMTGIVAGSGGLCKVRGEYRVIIDRRLGPSERAQVLANALRTFAPAADELSEPVRALLAS